MKKCIFFLFVLIFSASLWGNLEQNYETNQLEAFNGTSLDPTTEQPMRSNFEETKKTVKKAISESINLDRQWMPVLKNLRQNTPEFNETRQCFNQQYQQLVEKAMQNLGPNAIALLDTLNINLPEPFDNSIAMAMYGLDLVKAILARSLETALGAESIDPRVYPEMTVMIEEISLLGIKWKITPYPGGHSICSSLPLSLDNIDVTGMLAFVREDFDSFEQFIENAQSNEDDSNS